MPSVIDFGAAYAGGKRRPRTGRRRERLIGDDLFFDLPDQQLLRIPMK